MLIQITNRCHQGCPHCMQDSNPLGEHMDFSTFKQVIKFGAFLGCTAFIISGGEPTEHPQFLEFCQHLDQFIVKNKLQAAIAITSNGTWFPAKTDIVKQLSKLRSFSSMQVYTNPKWYKCADFIQNHKDEINAIPGVVVDTTDIRSMQDLGRAKTCAEAQTEVATNKYHMSCLNSHLLFRQINTIQKLKGLVRPGIMCKPMVDFKGDVHMSESWLCPSFGNVNTDYMMEIFNNLRNSQPCYGCSLGKKFMESSDPNIVMARELLSSAPKCGQKANVH